MVQVSVTFLISSVIVKFLEAKRFIRGWHDVFWPLLFTIYYCTSVPAAGNGSKYGIVPSIPYSCLLLPVPSGQNCCTAVFAKPSPHCIKEVVIETYSYIHRTHHYYINTMAYSKSVILVVLAALSASNAFAPSAVMVSVHW